MTKKRYNSRAQEKFFQPLRVLVLKGWTGYSSFSGGYATWQPVIYDKMDCTIVAKAMRGRTYQGKDGTRHTIWSDETPPKNWRKAPFPSSWTKVQATEIAKATAIKRQLPFNLSKDIIDDKEIEKGPYTLCLLCGENPVYTRNPYVCRPCRAHWHTGVETSAGLSLYGMYVDGLVASWRFKGVYSKYEHLVDQFPKSLAALAGRQIQKYRAYIDKAVSIIKRQDSRGSLQPRIVRVDLTESQAKAMQELVNLVNEMIESAFLEGKSQGSSLVTRLAKGEIHPDDFTALRDVPHSDTRQLNRERS